MRRKLTDALTVLVGVAVPEPCTSAHNSAQAAVRNARRRLGGPMGLRRARTPFDRLQTGVQSRQRTRVPGGSGGTVGRSSIRTEPVHDGGMLWDMELVMLGVFVPVWVAVELRDVDTVEVGCTGEARG